MDSEQNILNTFKAGTLLCSPDNGFKIVFSERIYNYLAKKNAQERAAFLALLVNNVVANGMTHLQIVDREDFEAI